MMIETIERREEKRKKSNMTKVTLEDPYYTIVLFRDRAIREECEEDDFVVDPELEAELHAMMFGVPTILQFQAKLYEENTRI